MQVLNDIEIRKTSPNTCTLIILAHAFYKVGNGIDVQNVLIMRILRAENPNAFYL